MKSICYYVAAVAILFATSGCQKDSEDTLSVGDKKIEFKTSIVNENPISGNIKKPVMNDDGSGIFLMEMSLLCMFCLNRVSLQTSNTASESPICIGKILISIQRIIKSTFQHVILNRS